MEDLKIIHYNCQGIANEERVYEFERELGKIKWDIIGISETRRCGEELTKRNNGNWLFSYGETKGHRGVGFYVKNSLTNRIIECKGINERIAVLKLKLNSLTNITIIQVYAPTSVASDNELDEFYKLLNKTYKEESEYYTIIMGDFNAKIGTDISPSVNLGKYRIGNTNDSGVRLVEFAMLNNLKIAESFFKSKANKKWTWKAPDGLTKNEIDHLLINDMRVVTKVATIASFNFPSDHRMVRCNIRLPRRARYYNYQRKKLKSVLNIPPHKIDAANAEIRDRIRDSKFYESEDVQEMYDIIVNAIEKTSQRVGVEKTNVPTDDKLSIETKDLLNKRTNLKNENPPTFKTKIELTELNKVIRKAIRKDLKNYEFELAREIIEETWSTKKVRKAIMNSTKLLPKLTKADNNVTYNRDEILDIATKFYSNLYSKDTSPQTRKPEILPMTEPVPPILTSEIEKALHTLRKNRAPGPDRIENEILKSCANALTVPLTILFNKIIETKIVPTQWNIAEIILLHKKGPRENINNYRPISLTANLSKVFLKIIKNRTYPLLDRNQPCEQAGFRKKYSTVDHIHAVNQLFEKAREYNVEINALFIDFNKAFDTVYHEKIWEALARQGTPVTFIKILQNLYKNASAYVKLDKKGTSFRVKRGVRQGDPLSPNLFNAVLEHAFRMLDWEEKGIRIDGKRLNNLRFADDVILVSSQVDELGKMAADLKKVCEEVGLKINMSKTKFMSNNPKAKLLLDGTELEKVEEYSYLGQTISTNNKFNAEINKRIKNGWKSFWALKYVFKSKMKLPTKIKILDSCVIPSLTYGAQTWALTKTQRHRLQVTQNRMLRSILNVKTKDKIRNATLYNQANTKTITYKTAKLKFSFAGHLARERHDKWHKRITDWTPYNETRRKGRPATRWRDEIEGRVGVGWGRVAQNRKTWEKTGEAYARELGGLA